MANERARAILAKYLPQSGDTPGPPRAMDFSLRQVARFVPALTEKVLEAIDKELAEL
jgi:hypothetical protein